MYAQLMLADLSNTSLLLLLAAGLILGLLVLKFLLRLAWRIFTIGCFIIVLATIVGSVVIYFLK